MARFRDSAGKVELHFSSASLVTDLKPRRKPSIVICTAGVAGLFCWNMAALTTIGIKAPHALVD
jgi:hypothetical protein